MKYSDYFQSHYTKWQLQTRLTSFQKYKCFITFPQFSQQPPMGPRLPHYRDFTITLRHTTLWTGDQPDAETSTWEHTTLKEKGSHTTRGIRTRNPNKLVDTEPGHWPRCRRYRLFMNNSSTDLFVFIRHPQNCHGECIFQINVLIGAAQIPT
jgi:hypothetical protein